jgi:hypothetical protein
MSGSTLSAGKLDDLAFAPITFPFDDSCFALRASNQEDIDRHGKSELPDRDAHLPVDHFVLGNLIHPEGQAARHLSFSHTRLGMAERGGVLTKSKGLTLRSPEFSTK